jgi:integrase
VAKRGRKASHYTTKSGEPIVGLRRDSKSGRFYPVGMGSPSFGTEEAKAIHRFRMWQAKKYEEPQVFEIPVSTPAYDDFGTELPTVATFDAAGNLVNVQQVSKAAAAAYFSKLIYDDPNRAATELDCEPLRLLANVEILKPPPPSKQLTTLFETYLDDKTLTPKEATNSRTWWREFASITKAKVVTDLDRESFKGYRKTIKSRQGKHSNVWVRSRFGKVKTIINHAIVEVDLTDQEKNALSHVALLKQPPKPTPIPVDIEPEQMGAILAAGDEWDQALILLALNAAYTNIDCQRLRWDMVDFKRALIRFDRSKAEHLTEKEMPRICALWDRTIEALKRIKNGHPRVFVSTQGQPAHIDTMNDHFVECCEKAEIKKRLTFKHLRKSALTSASNDPSGVPDRQINLLAGHSSGIKENYVVRRNVQLACAAIERYYFG